MTLAGFVFIGGILHLGTLAASVAVPSVLDWPGELRKLSLLTRQLVWVHGAFIVLTILGFGLLAVFLPEELASGTPLARGISLLIAFFWGARLAVQFLVFDPRPFLNTWLLAIGYRGLTLVFIYQTVVFFAAAFLPH